MISAKKFILDSKLVAEFKEFDQIFLRSNMTTRLSASTIFELVSRDKSIKSYFEVLDKVNFKNNQKLKKQIFDCTYNLMEQINIYCLESIDAWHLPTKVTLDSINYCIQLLDELIMLRYDVRESYDFNFSDAWHLLALIYLQEFSSAWSPRIKDEYTIPVDDYLSTILVKYKNILPKLKRRLFIIVNQHIPFGHLAILLNNISITFEEARKIQKLQIAIAKKEAYKLENLEVVSLPQMYYTITQEELEKPYPNVFTTKIILPPVL